MDTKVTIKHSPRLAEMLESRGVDEPFLFPQERGEERRACPPCFPWFNKGRRGSPVAPSLKLPGKEQPTGSSESTIQSVQHERSFHHTHTQSYSFKKEIFTLTAVSEPSSLKSSNFITSAIMNPFSKSV